MLTLASILVMDTFDIDNVAELCSLLPPVKYLKCQMVSNDYADSFLQKIANHEYGNNGVEWKCSFLIDDLIL